MTLDEIAEYYDRNLCIEPISYTEAKEAGASEKELFEALKKDNDWAVDHFGAETQNINGMLLKLDD